LNGVAVVEDHPLYRQGLMSTIEAASEIELVVAVGSIGEMEEHGYLGVDVVLLDLHLPDGVGAEAVGRVRAKGPTVLVISASDDRQSVVEAIGAGASGYVPKSSVADEIAKATIAVAAGGMYVSPVLAAYLLHDDRNHTSDFDLLSAREREILSLLAEGETDAEIADQLFISVRTVHSHLDRIRDKTGRRRRADLTRLVMEQQDQLHK
jgi:DNA-binding NarL/FixJ family response regulator